MTLKIALFFVVFLPTSSYSDVVINQPKAGITVKIKNSGNYEILTTNPLSSKNFSGLFCRKIAEIKINNGKDELGLFKRAAFGCPLDGRLGEIKVYEKKAAVLFSTEYDFESENPEYFSELHLNLYEFNLFSYRSLWKHEFNNPRPASDSPFILFDRDSAVVISAASNFLIAEQNLYGSLITLGINQRIKKLPDEFKHRWVVVFGNRINQTVDLWGQVLADLGGKSRPANDGDILLQKLSHWTNAPYDEKRYYYHFDKSLGYEGTLFAVKKYFDGLGIALGLMELDSWHYPKGDPSVWTAKKPSWGQGGRGIYKLEGDKNLFPKGLDVFQKKLGLPLATHTRWWDEKSPDRLEYEFSGNVPVDQKYWAKLADRLVKDGVKIYIQDWLSERASTEINTTDPDKFMDYMAEAMQKAGITIQYCMPAPKHFLQGSKYGNVTTIRASEDGFDRKYWDGFLYHSRFAGALGVWPFSDNLFSSDAKNILLATLSAGPVGLADPIGQANKDNILKSARPDGVIVKPDVSVIPTDETYLAEASKKDSPMVAFTHTKHESGRTIYVFAYSRGEKPALIKFNPAKLGIAPNKPVYVYDFFKKMGMFMPNSSLYFSATVDGEGSYFIISATSGSGIAVLGDENKFVSAGKKRIPAVKHESDGSVLVDVSFAEGEKEVIIYGYSATKPQAESLRGETRSANYDESTKLFRFVISRPEKGFAKVKIKNTK